MSVVCFDKERKRNVALTTLTSYTRAKIYPTSCNDEFASYRARGLGRFFEEKVNQKYARGVDFGETYFQD